MKAAILFCANNTKLPETLKLVAEFGYTRIVEGTDTRNCIVGNHVMLEGPDVAFDRWFFEQGNTGVWFNTNACIQLELFEHLVHVGVVLAKMENMETSVGETAPTVEAVQPKSAPGRLYYNCMLLPKEDRNFKPAVSASVAPAVTPPKSKGTAHLVRRKVR